MVPELYKSLIMEIRPRLQSVNVYITLLKPEPVVIGLYTNNFVVNIGAKKQVIHTKEFCIKPNSLTCFSNRNNQVTFRFATDSFEQQLGTSQCELLELNMKSCTISVATDMIPLLKNKCYEIICKNCSKVFCEEAIFNRILPLPENLDLSDWFCHAHPEKFSIIPKVNEVFYSECFVFLSPDLLNGIEKKDSVLHCRGCSTWVGTLEKGVVKVWFNTVIFVGSSFTHTSTALTDCLKILQIGNSPYLRPVRVIIKYVGNSCDKVILLWILEACLRVNFNNKVINNVAKVLYKLEKNGTDLISQWMSDINVTVFDVSQPMFKELEKHLEEMSRYIPKDFSVSNGFRVSYIKHLTD
ncbi:hypothetical protein FQA39_LY05548 [Lamprigera yunnana]|nr:hypothetical protein FQA39_LY05548 [Lamprigera yunnana]